MLGTPKAVHPRLSTATDMRDQGADRAHTSVSQARRPLTGGKLVVGETSSDREGTSVLSAPEGARRREWRSGGSTHCRAANTDHGEVRERVRERRESKVNEMCARGKEEGERRVGVHRAALFGELGRNSGEQLQRLGALPLQAEASTGYA
jgi:hypothetical protein